MALTQHESRSEPVGTREGPAPRPPSSSPWARAVVVAVVAVVAVAGLARVGDLLPSFNPFSRQSVDRSQPSLLQAIEDLSEYRAATGQFQVVIDVEDDTRFVPPFIRGERTQFLAGGSVDASVDFTALGAGPIEVSDDGQGVTVRLPHARLSQPRVDPERSYVISRQRGLIDRAGSMFSDSPTGERDLYLLAEDKLAAAAVDGGLVERAEANTVTMLKAMLASLGFTDVTVVFEGTPPV